MSATTRMVVLAVSAFTLADGAGARRQVAKYTDRIVISLTERKLTLMHDGKPVGEYEIAVGKPGTPTPTGEFHIANKQAFRGSNGIYGTRWMEFHRTRAPNGVLHLFGIHGTNAPLKIGDAVSHGCIRMSNKDVEQVFRRAHIGEPVEIVDAPVTAGRR